MDGTNLNCINQGNVIHWRTASRSDVNQLETQQYQANSKCTSSPSLFPVLYLSNVPLYCTLVDYPNLTGSQFSSTRTIFIFQVECVLKYMLLFRPNFILSVLNPLVPLCGLFLYYQYFELIFNLRNGKLKL